LTPIFIICKSTLHPKRIVSLKGRYFDIDKERHESSPLRTKHDVVHDLEADARSSVIRARVKQDWCVMEARDLELMVRVKV